MTSGIVVPVSVVIATRDRAAALSRTLQSLAAQSAVPQELIVIDASSGEETRRIVEAHADAVKGTGRRVLWQAARATGAAVQRNEGVARVRHDLVAFIDDDVLFEEDCIRRLFDAFAEDPQLGGASALITNQSFAPPGRISRMMYAAMAGRPVGSFAGKVLGPAVNVWPEDRDDLPEIVPVEWLYTTCVFYRRALLPDPPFDRFFTGYSIGEDLTISLRIGRVSKLANVRRARIFHDSQPGAHKADPVALSRMHLVNRYYVMTKVLGRKGLPDFARLALWETFQLAVAAIDSRGGPAFWHALFGRTLGIGDVLRGKGAE